MSDNLINDNEKLIVDFGAKRISDISKLPDFYAFNKNLVYSHRDFDKFLEALNKGEKCAIVSGVNASGTLHFGHKVVFDTLLFFQKKYDLPVFIPISDDESFVSRKVDTQEQSKEYSLKLAKEIISYGFNPDKTIFIIDNIYTNIYNLAFKMSIKINYSEIKAVYGYTPDKNIGLHFYPAVQTAHILFPKEQFGIDNILVPIGPDEDAHLRIARDVANKYNIKKPATIHFKFLPGLDSNKMSKSRGNAIFLDDDDKTLKKKCGNAFSGGQPTVEEHRKLGGNPEIDISCQYLKYFFLNEEDTNKLFEDYRAGKLLSGEVKNMLFTHLSEFVNKFRENKNKIDETIFNNCILKNSTDLKSLFKK